MWLRLLTPLAVAGLCLVVAPVGIFVGAVLLALQLAIIAIRICATIWIPRNPGTENVAIAPIFSVHVATHNEPPEMVIATLTALTQLDWPASDFEVIVMDNNTGDARLWCPVADWCATRNVHFIHRMGVQGAKAGALNIALQATRADATHIVTVDADYRVSKAFSKWRMRRCGGPAPTMSSSRRPTYMPPIPPPGSTPNLKNTFDPQHRWLMEPRQFC